MEQERNTLVIGCSEASAHRAEALLSGTLAVPGCAIRSVPLRRGDMLLRAFTDPELNVAELSLSDYVRRVAEGDCPYALLPVYIRREFPHLWFYVRSDAAISSPQDLRGKRVGIGAYQRTLNVWARGFLQQEYGLHPEEVRWMVKDDADAVGALVAGSFPFQPIESDRTLSALLELGELDAIIAGQPPAAFQRGDGSVRRIFRDPVQAASEYFRGAGVFPILHAMGIRRGLIDRAPRVARDLLRAFDSAKLIAHDHSEDEHRSWTSKAFSYGVGLQDTNALQAFARYHFEQGLCSRQLTVPDLFRPLSTDYYGD